FSPEVIIDLSDEPILYARNRLAVASGCLAEGISYVSGETLFTPPVFNRWSKRPTLGVFGTGKRVGKTTANIWITRKLLEANIRPIVVSMGRGGPSEPE